MMNTVQVRPAAFDAIAPHYDDLFTSSSIGRAQRDAVWDVVRRHLRPGSSVLELNCGTGEDALFLAQRGMKVVACDISGKMIELAQLRASRQRLAETVEFFPLAIEDLAQLLPSQEFNAVFSNFSGLNCVADLHKTATDLAHLLPARSMAILCFSGRFCLWEVAWYLLHGRARKAFRRWTSKPVAARIGSEEVTVRYPSVAAIAADLLPYFRLTKVYGIGVTVPPSYLEAWARRVPIALRIFRRVDRVLSGRPFFRSIGDHVVLVLERTSR